MAILAVLVVFRAIVLSTFGTQVRILSFRVQGLNVCVRVLVFGGSRV